jgi:hypothetical protein
MGISDQGVVSALLEDAASIPSGFRQSGLLYRTHLIRLDSLGKATISKTNKAGAKKDIFLTLDPLLGLRISRQ